MFITDHHQGVDPVAVHVPHKKQQPLVDQEFVVWQPNNYK